MDNSISIAILSALSVLLGIIVTGVIQARSLNQTQQFQLEIDKEKYEREQLSKHRDEVISWMLDAHKILSFISREFSITNIDILWRSEIPEKEYDQRYSDACSQLDIVKAFAGMFEPEISENLYKLSYQMIGFWENFQNLLYQTSQGKTPDQVGDILSMTHTTAREVGNLCSLVQNQLSQKMIRLKNRT
jgi:hypothetical protein